MSSFKYVDTEHIGKMGYESIIHKNVHCCSSAVGTSWRRQGYTWMIMMLSKSDGILEIGGTRQPSSKVWLVNTLVFVHNICSYMWDISSIAGLGGVFLAEGTRERQVTTYLHLTSRMEISFPDPWGSLFWNWCWDMNLDMRVITCWGQTIVKTPKDQYNSLQAQKPSLLRHTTKQNDNCVFCKP